MFIAWHVLLTYLKVWKRSKEKQFYFRFGSQAIKTFKERCKSETNFEVLFTAQFELSTTLINLPTGKFPCSVVKLGFWLSYWGILPNCLTDVCSCRGQIANRVGLEWNLGVEMEVYNRKWKQRYVFDYTLKTDLFIWLDRINLGKDPRKTFLGWNLYPTWTTVNQLVYLFVDRPKQR